MKLIDYKALHEITGLHEVTLRRKVSRHEIPFIKLGRSVRFDVERIEKWFKEHSVEPEE